MRRNLTKGQQAMVMTMMCPETERGSRGKKAVASKSGAFCASSLTHPRRNGTKGNHATRCTRRSATPKLS